MKLCFFRKSSSKPNFGDELNPWLWSRLLPDVLDDNDEVAFLGIGTLLNNRVKDKVPHARKIVVFSTGVGYGSGLPEIDETWKIYCLRGPLSAQTLGLADSFAVADGALLTRRVFQPTASKRYQFAYIPHYSQAIQAEQNWRSVCQKLGFEYIDPRWSVEQVLTAISQTEVLLAEAMHGAIIADVLRVPWIPVHTNPSILAFKWQDWCTSMQVQYQPQYLRTLMDRPDPGKPHSLNLGNRCLRAGYKMLDLAKQQQAIYQLEKIAKTASPTLSDNTRIEYLTNELEARLQQFRDDVRAGYFS